MQKACISLSGFRLCHVKMTDPYQMLFHFRHPGNEASDYMLDFSGEVSAEVFLVEPPRSISIYPASFQVSQASSFEHDWQIWRTSLATQHEVLLVMVDQKSAHRQSILDDCIKDRGLWHAGVTVLLDSIYRQYREGILLPWFLQQCLKALSHIMAPNYPDQVPLCKKCL